MDKQDIIDRFDQTIAMLNQIPTHKWGYSAWISDYSVENKCGSVCCALGWYPKFIPESGLKWLLEENILHLVGDKEGNDIADIVNTAAKWHGVNQHVIKVIFTSGDISFKLPNDLVDPLDLQEGWKEVWGEYMCEFGGGYVMLGYSLGSDEVHTSNVITMIEFFQWLIKNDYINYQYYTSDGHNENI